MKRISFFGTGRLNSYRLHLLMAADQFWGLFISLCFTADFTDVKRIPVARICRRNNPQIIIMLMRKFLGKTVSVRIPACLTGMDRISLIEIGRSYRLILEAVNMIIRRLP